LQKKKTTALKKNGSSQINVNNNVSSAIQNSWVNTANHTQRELIATTKKNNHSIASINSGQGSLNNSNLQLYTKN